MDIDMPPSILVNAVFYLLLFNYLGAVVSVFAVFAWFDGESASVWYRFSCYFGVLFILLLLPLVEILYLS